MSHIPYKKICLVLLICLTALAGFSFLYHHDNKYTSAAPVTANGTAAPDPGLLAEGRAVCLPDGWLIYPDALLSPEELAATDITPVPLWIGEHLSFSSFHPNRSPYGTATYVLNLTATPGVYSILIPEVYSACRVFVNGTPTASSGSLTPYASGIEDLVFSFSMDHEARIVIQTANYTHYYSGLTFPPVFGTPETIHYYTSLRMAFYGFLCFSALATALFSVAVWISARKRKKTWLSLLFAGLAISFSIRVSYPFLHLLPLPAARLFYALEDGASLFGIWCVLQIVLTVGSFRRTVWAGPASRFSLGMTAVATLVPLFLLPAVPAFTPVYGLLISWYRLLAAVFLAALTLAGTIRHGALWAVSGTAVYAVSLAVSVLGINRMEPIVTGWPDEYGAFVLVLCFAGLMVSESRALVLDNIRLTDHLQEEVDLKTRQLSRLVNERQKLLSEFLHDIKSPVSSLAAYTGLIRSNGLFLDGSTKELLDAIEAKSLDVTSQIRTMQEFTVENPLLPETETLDLSALVQTFYRSARPDADARGIYLKLSPLPDGCLIRGNEKRLIHALQNLFFNALDFTPEDGEVCLSLTREKDTAVITVRDSGCGISPEALPKIFDRLYTTRAGDGGTGLGLYIVKLVAEEHGGTVSVTSVPQKGSIFSITLPLL